MSQPRKPGCPADANLMDVAPQTMHEGSRRHVYLARALIYREIVTKYRGSYLGIAWSLLYPLLILASFTLVFGKIVHIPWPAPEGRAAPAPLLMYCGLIVFNFFAETLGTAPRYLVGYQSYIKKTVFPAEVLPVVLVFTAGFHTLTNLLLLLLGVALLGHLSVSLALLPLILLPMLLVALGATWFLAALGAYVRDLAHATPVALQLLMFLSPVFYPSSAVPESVRWLYVLNPVATLVEALRDVAVWGHAPQWMSLAMVTGVGLAMSLCGYAFFMHSKAELADVL
ncbi:MAG: ABC transporter permease [Candidatus Accumulibacter sp.]|uniref:ABC transporter permease n=1 Tax=Accumulibacter sp. TaxID=2053492 RepID=UPI0025FF80E6|nr:ABC transporter permease [Accumulibacter sp.]MCP5249203.1 ABC transporter permease [Accumulibacter sp.]